MSNKPNFDQYPHFIQGQLLTYDDLNNLVKYLDNQSHLSRTELIGTGIISGLSVLFKEEKRYI